MQIATAAQLEGFYYKPRVDKEFLAAHAEGLIALSSCGSGEVPRLLQNNRPQRARKAAEWYRDVFGPEGFFLELQDHDIPEMAPVNKALVEMSRETGIPLVATNDVHYVRRDQAYAHEVLLCIQTGKTMNDPHADADEQRQLLPEEPGGDGRALSRDAPRRCATRWPSPSAATWTSIPPAFTCPSWRCRPATRPRPTCAT